MEELLGGCGGAGSRIVFDEFDDSHFRELERAGAGDVSKAL